jgi:prevent-host-death family protein
MDMKTYSISKAREHLAEIVDAVAQGEEVKITRHGEVVAKVTPAQREKEARLRLPPPGFLKAEGWALHMAEDFDAVPEGFEEYV